jgi:hypothetical protein
MEPDSGNGGSKKEEERGRGRKDEMAARKLGFDRI